MEIEFLNPTDLIPYENNSRIHPEKQIEKLAESIKEIGIVLPILIDANNVIVAGHAVTLAAMKIGLSEIPCVRASHMTEAQVKAYIIFDNRVAEDASWDKEKLKIEMLSLRDRYGISLEKTGFENREILRLRMDVAQSPKDEDEVPEEAGFITSKIGDIWILGKNRLMCGSSTDKNSVEKLLAGSKPHLMVTDPPYGVNYDPEWRNRDLNQNNVRRGEVLNDDCDDWSEAWKLFPGDVVYVWHASLHSETVARSLRLCGFKIRAQIIWAKPHFALSRGEYHWQHEPCFYAVRDLEMPGYYDGYEVCEYGIRERAKSHWQGSRSESTLWEIDFRNQDMQTTHGTQKPVECMRRPMLNNSDINEIIYEPFSGSGTSLIAAESCHRICYAMELSPEYVDMAVRRWQKYTGSQAILEGTERTFDEISEMRGEAVA